MAAAAVVLAIVGLSPSLSWVPEVPLLAAAALLPIAIFSVAGYRAGERARQVLAGTSRAVSPAPSAEVSGASPNVAFGKPVLNIAVGVLVGAVGGSAIGTAGALLGRRAAGA
ncbi:MAG TPA: hypothetical protein VGU71_07125 [Candidatus Dormibacteraeota bacterium]|nr:hypothetical protein [Candidatus Dormibacteraeota bacterium]